MAQNDYSLSVTSYVIAEDTRVDVDIEDLNSNIEANVTRQSALRSQIDAIVSELEGVEK